LTAQAVVGGCACSLTHIRVRSLACSPPPRPGPPSRCSRASTSELACRGAAAVTNHAATWASSVPSGGTTRTCRHGSCCTTADRRRRSAPFRPSCRGVATDASSSRSILGAVPSARALW